MKFNFFVSIDDEFFLSKLKLAYSSPIKKSILRKGKEPGKKKNLKIRPFHSILYKDLYRTRPCDRREKGNCSVEKLELFGAKEEERSGFGNWGGGQRRKSDGIGACARPRDPKVAGTRGQRGPSLDGDATRAGDARPSRREAGGSFLPPTHTRAHARGIINICYCTYIRAGRPVSPPPPATGRTLNTLSPCLHMVRAWNRAVESECGAIDPEQWDRAVFVPRALRKRPSSFFHPKDKILPPLIPHLFNFQSSSTLN